MALALLVIWYVGGLLVIVPLLILPLVAVYGFVIQKPLRESIEASFRSSAQKNAALVESLIGMETIKILGAEGAVQSLWEKSVGHIAVWGQRSRLISSSVVNVSAFLQQLTMVFTVVLGCYLIADHALTMGALVAVVMLSNRIAAPISI